MVKCGIHRRERFECDSSRAAMFVWKVEGPYNTKWRKAANWLNGYLLHLSKNVWKCKTGILEPRVLYIGEMKPLGFSNSLKFPERKAKKVFMGAEKLVRESIPEDWIENEKGFYPAEPSFVLWCHADLEGKQGLFAKAKEVVERMLKTHFEVPFGNVADVSGIFWTMGTAVFDWDKITILKMNDNDFHDCDLPNIVAARELCKNLQRLRILAGNSLTKELLEKTFPNITIC